VTPGSLREDWIAKARYARTCQRADEPWPAWSTGEELAVALILQDTGRLESMEYTVQQALDRVRHDLHLDTWEAAAVEFGRMRHRVDVLDGLVTQAEVDADDDWFAGAETDAEAATRAAREETGNTHTGRRKQPRRTPVQKAADDIVDAVALIIERVDDLTGSDQVALEDARAVVERLRQP
jgi:hypothetical protein